MQPPDLSKLSHKNYNILFQRYQSVDVSNYPLSLLSILSCTLSVAEILEQAVAAVGGAGIGL